MQKQITFLGRKIKKRMLVLIILIHLEVTLSSRRCCGREGRGDEAVAEREGDEDVAGREGDEDVAERDETRMWQERREGDEIVTGREGAPSLPSLLSTKNVFQCMFLKTIKNNHYFTYNHSRWVDHHQAKRLQQ